MRAVRHPAPRCSFTLGPTWGTAPVAASGLIRGTVLVYGQTPECSHWEAYSSVDWVTVEAAPSAAQPTAFVTVTANPTTQARSTTLAIAGVRLVINQEGAALVSPPIAGNLLVNGTFDKDIAAWGWQSRFPNGLGTAAWSQFDGNGSPASGSILMRDVDFVTGQAFQRLQCVRLDGGFSYYEYGAKVRTGSTGGVVEITFITFTSTDCSDEEYRNYYVSLATPPAPGVWQKFDFVNAANSSARSAIIVLAVAADPEPPFEVWFDDVYLRKK